MWEGPRDAKVVPEGLGEPEGVGQLQQPERTTVAQKIHPRLPTVWQHAVVQVTTRKRRRRRRRCRRCRRRCQCQGQNDYAVARTDAVGVGQSL